MIEIRITKEIGNYEPKFIGPFTLRQIVCIIIAAPICYFIFKTLSPVFTPDVAGFFCAIPAGVAALFGWVKPYGMKTEKFLQSVWINMFIAPTHRRYKSENRHEQMLEKLESAYDRMMEEQKASELDAKKTYKLPFWKKHLPHFKRKKPQKKTD